jgi:hypothetical protein
MAKDADKILVANNGTVYLSPGGVSSNAPTNFASALHADFVDYGYVSDEGVTVTFSKETMKIPAWQAVGPVRTIVTGRSLRLQFNLMEWKELTTELATEGVTSGAPSEWATVSPDSDDVLTYSCVIEWEDGSARGYRLYMPRVAVVDDIEFKLSRKEFAGFPITLEAFQDADTGSMWTIFTNDAFLEESTE